MRTTSRFNLACLVTVAVFVAACGGSSDADVQAVTPSDLAPPAAETCLAGAPDCADTGGDDPASPPPVPDEPGDGEFPVLPEPVISEPGGAVAFSNPQPWDELRDDPDGLDTTMWVTFTSSPAPCTIVDRVEVIETVFSVEIALFTGPAAGSEDVACPAIAEYRAVPVTLTGAVSGRQLVDPADLDPEGTPQ